MKNLQNIKLVTFGGVEKQLLKELALAIQQELQVEVDVLEKYFDITLFYDPGRRQYNADKLLAKLKDLIPSEKEKIIGVFKVDLFIPILTYIFGQALLNGQFGVVSYYRLQNERYGLVADKDLLKLRLKKEIIHELGHTFGLIHCKTAGCVMQSSTYVEEIDLKTKSFCNNCKNLLSK